MLSDETRKRLQKLNRAPLRKGRHSREPERTYLAEWLSMRISLPRVFRKPGVIKGSERPFVRLSDTAGGREIQNRRGRFLVVERDTGAFIDDPEDLNSRYAGQCVSRKIDLQERSLRRDVRSFLGADPLRVLFLDIETTGFWATPLFLVGLLSFDGGSLRIRQLFAREYAEEAPLLEYLSGFLKQYDCLVTFNGKSFDMPFMRQRAWANMVDLIWNGDHLDLLHECRRRYRKKFGNHRLKTLEECVCRRLRSGDIPSHQIPDAYHSFVRTGNAYRIHSILHHNGLDLITMAELLINVLPSEEQHAIKKPERFR